jgi:hypothetical protein
MRVDVLLTMDRPTRLESRADDCVARVGLIIVNDVRSKRRSAGYRSVKRGMTVVLVVIFCLFKLLTSREEW